MAINQYVKDGKTLFEVYVIGRDEQGNKIQRRRRGIQSKREAGQVEFELKKEVESVANEEVPMTWENWHAECIRRMHLTLRPSTVQSYEGQLKKWVHPVWKAKDVKALTQSNVHELIYESIDASISPHTRKCLLKMVRRVLEMAVIEGIMDRNPCKGISVSAPEGDKKVLTTGEAQKLLAEARACCHRFYPVWALALLTGMRSGELFALKWQNVDLDNRSIHVVEQWTSKCGFGPTKTKKSRVTPLNDALLVFLKELKLRGAAQSEFVLPRLKEWENGEQALVTREFCESIGITPVAFHDLRATFITNLLGRGESLGRVMAMVGHTQLKTTNVYLRLAGVEVKGGTEKLGYTVPSESLAQVVELKRPV